MRLRGDSRGQSVWIGFLFLLGFLLLALTVYQASVVPDQIARAEADHAAAVRADVQTLLSRVGLLRVRGGTLSVAVDLSPDYPPRLLALNSPPPSGSLQTTTAGNATVAVGGSPVNLSRTCGYGGDATVPTRSLAYSIDYNRYRAGTLVYDHSVLYRVSDGSHVLLSDDQSIVSGRTVTLAPLATGYATAGSDVETVRLVGGPVDRRTLVAGPAEPVRVAFPSGLPATKWETLFANESAVKRVEQVAPRRVAVVLAANRTYTLRCYGVGLGEPPPSGVQRLGDQSGTPTETPTGTETPSGDHPPNATLVDVTLQRMKKKGSTRTTVNVTWEATDVDGDLETVTVRVTNVDTANTESRTLRIDGTSASGTFVFEFPGAKKSDTFQIELSVVDSRGNRAGAQTTK